MSLLEQLGIDPSVLVLQVIAFLILYWVLRRFLFAPVLAIMARRETEIAGALDAGKKAQAELARIDEQRAEVLENAREQGREEVRQAVREGEEARQRILREAREEAQDVRQRARRAVELEREEARLALRQQVAELALMAASKAVLRRLDAETHRQVVDEFISSLEQRQ